MKKIIGILFIVLLSIPIAKAQQMPLFSQYMFSDFLINPAVAGTYDYYQIRTSHRFQWMGIQDPPITNSLGTYGPFQKQDMGWGAYIYSDVTGPTSKTGLYASYAFNFKISGDVRLSMGLSGGYFQYKLDRNKMEFEDNAAEPLNSVYTAYYPDASAGIYLYDIKKFSLGISAHQLVNNTIQVYDVDTSDVLNKLMTHAMITGAYKISISGRFQVEPSFFIKSVETSNIQAELTARMIYKKRYWLGAAFRSNKTSSALLGFDYDNKLFMGFAYDFGFGDDCAKISHGGTYELMLGYKFSPIFKPL